MRKGYVVKEKGYEYNDNWYDHDSEQDVYTNLFKDLESAKKHAKQFTLNFISGSSVYSYFNDKPYMKDLKDLINGDYFPGDLEVNSELFNKIWDLIREDIAVILKCEVMEGEPVVIHYSDGTKMYYKDNLLHRLDGPALEKTDGNSIWYYKGRKHRVNGPAQSNNYGDDYYYIEGDDYWELDEYHKAAAIWIQNHRDEKINTIFES